jgi:hypothetical protein
MLKKMIIDSNANENDFIAIEGQSKVTMIFPMQFE